MRTVFIKCTPRVRNGLYNGNAKLLTQDQNAPEAPSNVRKVHANVDAKPSQVRPKKYSHMTNILHQEPVYITATQERLDSNPSGLLARRLIGFALEVNLRCLSHTSDEACTLGVHLGLKTQGRCHQMSKTGPMTPQKDLCPPHLCLTHKC